MKAKVIVSLGVVVGLAALSVLAFVSTEDAIPADTKVRLDTILEDAIVEEQPIIMATESTETETFQVEEPVETFSQIETVSEEPVPGSEYLLAKIAMAEAEGEDIEGKALVMLVVLNRVKADGFPDTIEDVLYQPRQFRTVGSGKFDRAEPDDGCWQALSMIEQEGWDESRGATYFESKSESTWHEENLDFLFQHGNHYFYTDKGEGNE